MQWSLKNKKLNLFFLNAILFCIIDDHMYVCMYTAKIYFLNVYSSEVYFTESRKQNITKECDSF